MNKNITIFIWFSLVSLTYAQPQIIYTNALPAGLKSVNKGGDVQCIFENKSEDYIHISWINGEGNIGTGKEYLAPGNKGQQGKTKTGYVHVIMTLDAKILGYFTFERPGKVEVTIDPPK